MVELNSNERLYRVVSKNLVGRLGEHHDLTNLLNQCAKGDKQVALISGKPGVGKTHLARSIGKPTENLNGLFAEGKCDQFHLNSPYDVITQCITSIIDQILLLDPIQIEQIKSKLSTDLGHAAPIISRMIPKANKLIERKQNTSISDSFDFESTFHFATTQCIKIFTEFYSPLVIFIDDVQWMDPASLKMIQKISSARELDHLLLVLSYREEEYKNRQYVEEAIDSWKRKSLSIHLEDFSEPELEILLNNIFGTISPSSSKLAPIVYQKTKGNPFFAMQFLQTLIQDKMIVLDTENRNNGWRWNINSIQRAPISENAAIYMQEQVLRLSEPQKKILQVLACFGSDCSVDVIQKVTEIKSNLEPELDHLSKKSFLIKSEHGDQYRFSHDRIQGAAFSILAKENVDSIHRKIASALLENSETWIDDNIIKVVSHINKGYSNFETAELTQRIIELNINAAERALFAIAYSDAETYADFAVYVTKSSAIKLDYDLRYRLFFKAALCAQLNHSFQKMDDYLEHIKSFATNVDTLRILEIKISAHVLLREYEEAYQTCRSAVATIGVNLPNAANNLTIVKELVKTESYMALKGGETFKTLPYCEDEKIIIASRLLGIVFPAMYLHKTEILPVMVFKWIRLMLKNGLTIESPLAMSSYCMVIGGYFGKAEKCTSVAQMAVDILEREGKENYAKYRGMFVLCHNSLHLKMHWNKFFDMCEQGYIRALQFGDHEFAGFYVAARCYFAYEAGEKLDDIIELVESYDDKVKPINADYILDQFYRLNARACHLRGIENKFRGKGGIDFEAMYNNVRLELEDRQLTMYTVNMDRVMFRYLDDDFVTSFDIGSRVIYEKWAPLAPSESNIAFFTFLSGMKLLTENITHTFEISFIRKILKKAESVIAFFDTFESGNGKHRHQTIKAMLAAKNKRYSEANGLFQNAIQAAEKGQYRTDIGIIKEIYARFLIKTRFTERAVEFTPKRKEQSANEKIKAALLSAIDSYEDWGATPLSKNLVNRFKDLLDNEIEEENHHNMSTDDYSEVLSTIQQFNGFVTIEDCKTGLLKAISDFVGNIDHAAFIYKDNSTWIRGNTIGLDTQFDAELPFPKTLLNRAENLKENFFTRNATIEPGISKDRFILRENTYSYYSLCLVQQNELIGVIFLGSKTLIEANSNKTMSGLEFICGYASATLAKALLFEEKANSESQLRNILDSSNTGMMRIAADGSLYSINNTLAKWINVPQEKVKGQNIKTAQWAEELEILEAVESTEMEEGWHARDVVYISNGTELHINVTCKFAENKGQKYYDFNLTDKSEQVAKEREAHFREIAENKFAESSKFIDTITHELRSPIAVILSLTKQLLTQNDHSSDERVALESTLSNGQRLLKLVNDLLEFARRDSKATAELVEVDISEVITEVAKAVLPFLTISNTKNFIPRIEQNLVIKGVPDDIVKIAFNLIYNSFKFTAPDGTIKIDLYSENNIVKFVVTDDGVGIAEKEQPYIFDRFYQNNEEGLNNSGTGIGLALVKELVNFAGGAIRLKSQKGKGCEIETSFPQINILDPELVPTSEYDSDLRDTELAFMENMHRKVIDAETRPTILIIGQPEDYDGLAYRLFENAYNLIFESDAIELAELSAAEFDAALVTGKKHIDQCEALAKQINTPNLFVVGGTGPNVTRHNSSITYIEFPLEESRFKKEVDRSVITSSYVGVDNSDNTILIVDDEPDIRSVFTHALKDEYTIAHARDGKEAIDRIQHINPSLILLDVMMPNIDGMGVLSYVKKELKAPCKVIVLTANTSKEIVSEALSLGADDLLQKAVEVDELKIRVRNLIQSYNQELHEKYLKEELRYRIKRLEETEAMLILTEKHASISHIAKNILHELNNPISISMSAMEYVQSVVEQALEEEQGQSPLNAIDQESAELISDGAKDAIHHMTRAADILIGLKDYSDSDPKAQPKLEAIEDVIEQAISACQYDTSGINIVRDIESAPVTINKSKILQVFNNLITNADKATKLTKHLRRPEITIKTQVYNDALKVSFIDNGPGIPQDKQAKIFSAYFTEFESEGTGLGLHICQTILKEYQTELTVVSNGIDHTEFSFLLPLAASEEEFNAANE